MPASKRHPKRKKVIESRKRGGQNFIVSKAQVEAHKRRLIQETGELMAMRERLIQQRREGQQ